MLEELSSTCTGTLAESVQEITVQFQAEDEPDVLAVAEHVPVFSDSLSCIIWIRTCYIKQDIPTSV